MNKQQIEEIKKVIISVYGRIRTGGEDFLNNRQAEALYNAGYRKVPKYAVILTPEERDDEIKTYNEERVEVEKRIEKLNSQLVEYATENLKLKAEKREYEKPIDKFIKDREAQAVKEFAEWIKDHITDIPFCNQKAYNVFCDMINEKLKEYESGK